MTSCRKFSFSRYSARMVPNRARGSIMRGFKAIIVSLAMLLTTSCLEHRLTTKQVGPPSRGVYHAAYADFGAFEDSVTVERLDAFQRLVGKPIVWAYFSNNWNDSITFPHDAVQTLNAKKIVPFIRMMPWSHFQAPGPDSVYTLQRIIAGEFDARLRSWARAAQATKAPLIVEFGTEVNAAWFPWNGKFNGGNTTDGYGDPNVADGPERFRDAYRHIVRLFRDEGATNVSWAYHVLDPALASGKGPSAITDGDIRAFKDYYPGDEYVDWMGISIYGPVMPRKHWRTFTEIMDVAYPVLAAISLKKPLAIFEFGVVDNAATGDKAAWIRSSLQAIESGKYPRIKALSYWHENWVNGDGSLSNLRLDSSLEALSAYRAAIASRYFVTMAELH